MESSFKFIKITAYFVWFMALVAVLVALCIFSNLNKSKGATDGPQTVTINENK